MTLGRIIRFLRDSFKAKLRAALDWCALRILMLLEHEPSNDRVELLVMPMSHQPIRVCLPRDQVRMQLRTAVYHRDR